MRIDEKKLNKLGEKISAAGLKMSIVESMTAGFFSTIWSLQTESGDYFKGSIICFDESVKAGLLKIPKELITEFSAESMEVTVAMLKGVSNLIPADIYMSITGKAYDDDKKDGPSEPGDVYIVVSGLGKVVSRKFKFQGKNAAEVFILSFNASLDMLSNFFGKEG
ncbi:CinA family protein [Sphingobacterium endophyticum]|uniref:CinA family protein n=1 Tax=Sphingobacterium endophyticum TaxID=2546448 RepID=UPI0012E239DB|nr:nicotinamide-nucleotide amidohydrolase family protein [Sphingobacterium endophyticum]